MFRNFDECESGVCNGIAIANPRFLRVDEKQLAKLQRRRSKMEKGTPAHRKARTTFEHLYRLMLERSEYQNDGEYSALSAMVVAGPVTYPLCNKLAPELVRE